MGVAGACPMAWLFYLKHIKDCVSLQDEGDRGIRRSIGPCFLLPGQGDGAIYQGSGQTAGRRRSAYFSECSCREYWILVCTEALHTHSLLNTLSWRSAAQRYAIYSLTQLII